MGRFFFQAEDGIRDLTVTGVQTCALPIWLPRKSPPLAAMRIANPGERAPATTGLLTTCLTCGCDETAGSARDRQAPSVTPETRKSHERIATGPRRTK